MIFGKYMVVDIAEQFIRYFSKPISSMNRPKISTGSQIFR